MTLCIVLWVSLIAQMVKNPPAMQETGVRSLDWEELLVKEMATHFSILAWRIPWTGDPGGLLSMGCKESDTTDTFTVLHCPFSLVYVILVTPSFSFTHELCFVLQVLALSPDLHPTVPVTALPACTDRALLGQVDLIPQCLAISHIQASHSEQFL